jgi:ketosteroid isomerase-like protein
VKFEDRRRLVERSYEAWGTGDLETLFEIYHSDCEWDNSRLGLPDIPPVSRGHDGMAELRRVSLGMFPELFPVAREIVDLSDDRVLVRGEWKPRVAGTRLDALAAVPQFGQIIEFRDGRILRVEYFPRHEDARDAARVDLS